MLLWRFYFHRTKRGLRVQFLGSEHTYTLQKPWIKRERENW